MSMRSASWLTSTLVLLACASDSDPERGGGSGPGPGDGNGSLDGGQNGGDAGSGGEDAPTVVTPEEKHDACADVQITPVRTIPSVTFLVDGSSSMKCVYPEDLNCDCERQLRGQCAGQGTLTRWQALSQVLLGEGNTPGLLESRGDAVRFGMWIYNNGPAQPVCPNFPVQVAPALSQSAQLTAAFPAEPPGYNTPTGLALSALSAALPSAAEAKAMQLGPQKIVLATDGQPFVCFDPVTLEAPALDYAGVIDATQAARGRDIDLFVMSLAPASGDFAAHLNEVAIEGNTQKPYAPADKAQLSAALDEIIASAISCEVSLTGKIQAPEACKGTATLGGEALTCGDANGFVILDESRVRLQGTACDRFKHVPGIALSMTFPCDELVLQ